MDPIVLPEAPDVDDDSRVSGTIRLRYEDLTQDGRVKLTSLPHAVGIAWQKALLPHPVIVKAYRQGILPILSRVVITGTDHPVSLEHPLDVESCYQFARTDGDGDRVKRLLLCLWVEAFGVAGRQQGPPPENAGRRVSVGRVYAEHVFTRPFHPPGQRRVRVLPGDVVPSVRRAPAAPEEAGELPDCAAPLEDAPRMDPTVLVMGLDHTDSNQHVNSLVYPDLFRDAALRRLAELGRDTALTARAAEVAFRRPSFAGDRLAAVLQAFDCEGRPGAAGRIHALARDEDGDRLANVRVFLRMLFRS